MTWYSALGPAHKPDHFAHHQGAEEYHIQKVVYAGDPRDAPTIPEIEKLTVLVEQDKMLHSVTLEKVDRVDHNGGLDDIDPEAHWTVGFVTVEETTALWVRAADVGRDEPVWWYEGVNIDRDKSDQDHLGVEYI